MLRFHRALIYLCFVVSGAAGLVYEVVWEKQLALHMGATSSVHAILLSAFLGGLALGAWRLGAWCDRRANPIAIYAAFELAIGLGAALTTYSLPTGFQALSRAIPENSPYASLFGPLQVAWAYANLTPIAVLMGGTLPALARGISQSLEVAGERIGRLYFLNALGGSAAIVLTAVNLIPTLGLDSSVVFAAIFNLGAAALAWRVSRRVVPTPTEEQPSPTPKPQKRTDAQRWILGAVFVSGAVSLAYEIAWIRLMAMAMGSSVYAFAFMLSAFVAGIGLGGWAASSLLRRRADPFRWFILSQIGVAAALAVCLPFYGEIPFLFAYFSRALSHAVGTFWIYSTFQYLLCFAAMIGPAFFIGISLPMAMAAETDSMDNVGGRVGAAYGANALGNVLGAILAGHFLLPWLGVERLIHAGLALNALLAIGLMAALRARLDRPILLLGAPAVAFALISSVGMSGWFDKALGVSPFRDPERAVSHAIYHSTRMSYDILFHRDGRSQSVTVVDRPESRVMMNNNKPDASNQSDLETQWSVGFLPVALHPNPRSAFIIGLGSGSTVGMIAQVGSLERIDALEIEPAVFEANRFYAEWNFSYWEDPRVNVRLEDARIALARTQRKYDLIVNEPPNPWVAGVSNLFTLEFFELARSRLHPDGLFLCWVQNYEISDGEVIGILSTLRRAFAYVESWKLHDKRYDTAFIASMRPIPHDFDRFAQRFGEGRVAESYQRFGVNDAADLWNRRLLDHERLSTFPISRIHRDRLPWLEYSAPKSFFYGETSRILHFHAEKARKEKAEAAGEVYEPPTDWR